MKRVLVSLLLFMGFIIQSQAFAAGVNRAQFTTDIMDREPVDAIDSLSNDQNQIKYFTEIGDMQGQTVRHQWMYNDKVMFEKSFDIGGPRWRVWSSKTLQPGWIGTWTVNTVMDSGEVIHSMSFDYQ